MADDKVARGRQPPHLGSATPTHPPVGLAFPNLKARNCRFFHAPSSVTHGQLEIRVFAEIGNDGTLPSTECNVHADVRLHRGLTTVGLDKTCPPIAAGGRVDLPIGAVQNTAAQDAGPGQVVTVTVTVDSDGRVREANESVDDNTCKESKILPSLDDSGVPDIPKPDRDPPGPPG